MKISITTTRMLMALLLLAILQPAKAAQPLGEAASTETRAQCEARLAWWREARFGLFVNWGPVTLIGTNISWSRGGPRRDVDAEGLIPPGDIPVEVYDNLYKSFYPALWDARELVALAKAGGMKYIVFLTRHHDGFSMFDSKVSNYTIAHTPFKRDVVKELADACHEAGMPLGFYYSPPDWHHPDYRTERHAKYLEYLRAQLRELCTNYGKVDILWFDGLGQPPETYGGKETIAMVRKLQPRIVINNRLTFDEDFEPVEQMIGGFNRDKTWESCITLTESMWTWLTNEKIKSRDECLRTLVSCACGDGNLLLNVGPMPTGEVEPRQVKRVREIGAWLAQYGESIYATRGGPYKPGIWGGSTHKGNAIYLHVYEWPGEGLKLTPLGQKIVKSSVLTSGSVTIEQDERGLIVKVPQAGQNKLDTIVKLEVDGDASTIAPLDSPSRTLTTGKKAMASSYYKVMPQYGPDKAVDDNPWTRWSAGEGVKQAWLEVDLGSSTVFSRIGLSEFTANTIQSFELQYWDGAEWKTFHKGTTIGEKWTCVFPPVTAQRVRLKILDATGVAAIQEFQIYR